MDAKGIINQGLGHLGAYTVTSLEPANTPIEKRMKFMYPQARDAEMLKGRWVFTIQYKDLTLVPGAPHGSVDAQYGFQLPNNYLGAVKNRETRWYVRSGNVYAATNTLKLEYRARVDESLFDPLFIDVLALRIALDNCEWVTQSNTKKADIRQMYADARRAAVINNSLLLDEDETEVPDYEDSWIRARAGFNT